MSYIKEKVAYLRGLADGLDVGDDAQGKLIKAMIATMDEMASSIDEHEASLVEIDECIDDIYDSLDDIDDYLFDDDDYDDDFYEDEPEVLEVTCPHCGETMSFDSAMLENSDSLICPACNKSIIFIDSDDEDEDDD